MENEEKHGEIVVYNVKKGQVEIGVKLEDSDIWLNQDQMSKLFGKSRVTITEHLISLFKEEELEEKVVCRKFRHTTQHGAIQGKTQEKDVNYYNLDAIISVGYRVHSKEGTRFRIWARGVLKDHIVKGFTYRPDRFKELEDRVNNIQNTIETSRGLIKNTLTYSAKKERVEQVVQEIEKIKKDIERINKSVENLSKNTK